MKSYKVRESGNSFVVTLPNYVLEALKIKSSDEISYEVSNDTVILHKASNNEISDDFETVFKQSFDQYKEALTALVDK